MQVTMQPLERAEPAHGRQGHLDVGWRDAAILSVIFAGLMVATQASFLGDTFWYVTKLRSVFQGARGPTYLVDFSHMVWLIVSYAAMKPFGWLSWEARANAAGLLLVAISYVATLLAGIAMHWLCRVAGASRGASIVAAASLPATNTFVNYSRSAAPYIPGLAFVLLGCVASILADRTASKAWKWTAVACIACATLVWTPYVLAAPAIAAVTMIVPRESGRPWPKVVGAALEKLVPAGMIVLVVCAAIAYWVGVRDAAGFIGWVKEGAHGQFPGQRFVRMVFGIPRSFLALGHDGVLLKQYLFHDPYARVSIAWLFAVTLLRPAVLYSCGAAAAIGAFRLRRSRRSIVWCALAIVPCLALALAVDAGSPERYLGLYPPAFVMMALALTNGRSGATRAAAAVFAILLIGNNAAAQFRPRIAPDAETMRRVERIRTIPPGNNRLYVLDRDPIIAATGDAFAPEFRNMVEVRVIVPGIDSFAWRSQFANGALKTLRSGADVWVTKRLWAAAPQPHWLWVDGDVGVRWTDFTRVFAPLQWDAELGGDDGFRRIANSPANRDVLASVAVAC